MRRMKEKQKKLEAICLFVFSCVALAWAKTGKLETKDKRYGRWRKNRGIQ